MVVAGVCIGICATRLIFGVVSKSDDKENITIWNEHKWISKENASTSKISFLPFCTTRVTYKLSNTDFVPKISL